jgi:subtilase family serine protease
MRSTQRRAFGSLLAVATFAASSTLASATAMPSALVANVPQATGIRDLGRADARTSVQLAVMLKYRNEAQLDALLDEQRDTDSPLYHHFLTSAQFRNAFGPSEAAYARTIALLQHAGFTVTATYPNRTIVGVKAPAPTVERYFGTEIHRVAAGSGARYANVRPAMLPVELRDDVDIVLGFDNIEWFKPLFRIAHPQPAIPDVVIGQPLHGPNGGFGPLAFAQGYDFPVQHQIPNQPSGTTYDGTGRTAAISIPGDPSDTDLAKFLTDFKITRTGTTTRVKVDGGPQNPSEDTLLEASLDYQTISGVAPRREHAHLRVPDLH